MKVFKHRINSYNTVEVTDSCTNTKNNDSQAAPISVQEFEGRLWYSLQQWKKEQRNGVFMEISLDLVELVPVAVRAGFTFHHCESDYLVLSAWFKNRELNKLPPGPVHFLGVGGLVARKVEVNGEKECQILVVKEKSGPSSNLRNFWKLPGGLVDQHEDVREAAVREIREETGIDTEFGFLCSIQETHHVTPARAGLARKGTSDIYCICTLKPIQTDQEIRPQLEEIAQCKWMNLEEFLNLPYYSQEGTVFHKALRVAADVALGNSKGLEVSTFDLGFRSEVKNSLFTAVSKI